MQEEIYDDGIMHIPDREDATFGRQNISPAKGMDEDGAERLNKEAESADNEACEGKEGEKNEETLKEGTVPIYEQVGWKEKVQKFLQQYPIAKDFAVKIGKEIATNNDLSIDPSCLEKALAITLAKEYASPESLIADEEFLQKYVLTNQAVKDRIIQNYFDELQQNQPPKFISTRGQMTIAPPSRPKSIAEAGNVIKAMLNNRRI